MEEKLKKLEELINTYDNLLSTTMYEDDEYRMLFFDFIKRLKKVMDS